jgi:hypothetical protein
MQSMVCDEHLKRGRKVVIWGDQATHILLGGGWPARAGLGTMLTSTDEAHGLQKLGSVQEQLSALAQLGRAFGSMSWLLRTIYLLFGADLTRLHRRS